jgi:hypothetical protein
MKEQNPKPEMNSFQKRLIKIMEWIAINASDEHIESIRIKTLKKFRERFRR